MGKCMECGKETDKFLWSREEDRNKYSSGDLYLCDDCRNKRRDLYDWQNEQFEMEEIVCPWCGYEFSDSWEFDFRDSDFKEIECEECGNIFEVEAVIKREYTSRKRRCDFPGVGENNANE